MTLAVVIPAQNEHDRLPRCLAALDRSLYALQRQHRDRIQVAIVVVADRCHDDTEAIAAEWPGVTVISCDLGVVGAVRSLGIETAIATGGPTARMWIACTDADSEVPTDWLSTHLRFAEHGVDLLLGTVRPDPAELTRAARHTWLRHHHLGDGHPHIHGANLGVRADIYLRAGGFPAVAAHEDVALVRRVEALGGNIFRTGASPVLTSARTKGRAPVGMASYLRSMTMPILHQLTGPGSRPTTMADVGPQT